VQSSQHKKCFLHVQFIQYRGNVGFIGTFHGLADKIHISLGNAFLQAFQVFFGEFKYFYCFQDPFILLVNCTKSWTSSCSALLSMMGSLFIFSVRPMGLSAFLKVFLRVLNACFTTLKNNFSSQSRAWTSFLTNRITPLLTLGGGSKTSGGTLNKYSMS